MKNLSYPTRRQSVWMLHAMLLLLVIPIATPARAHHSTGMFDQRVVTVEGVIREFQYTNPHSWLLVDVTEDDGSVTTWGFEAEGPSTLQRAGITRSTLLPGTKITIRGNPMKDGRPAAAWIDAVLEDGRKINPRNGFTVR